MVVSGGRDGLANTAMLTKIAVAALVLAGLLVVAFAGAGRADAINLTQAEAPISVLTADPHQGAGDGVIDADTTGPAQVESSNNVVFLIAALGVLIGVLIVARPRRGPKS
jgi:hypothetical protein